MGYANRSGGARRAPANTSYVVDWDDEKVQQVVAGILKQIGILGNSGAQSVSEFEAMEASQYRGIAKKEPSYELLGREVALKLRKYAQNGDKLPNGALAVSPDRFGYAILGRERGFVDGMQSQASETAEVLTLGQWDPDRDTGFESAVEDLTGIDLDRIAGIFGLN